MKYSTVEIKPSGIVKDTWSSMFRDLPYDRKKEQIKPSILGFYHYPRKLGKKKAFNQLKTTLVTEHKNQIAALTSSLAKLELLEFPVNEE